MLHPLPPSRAAPAPARRGSLYALVLITVAAATAFVLVAADIQRAQRRSAFSAHNAIEARTLALAAIDVGIDLVNRNDHWRSILPSSGQWLSSIPLGRGTFSLSAADPVDNRFDNNTSDPITLTGEGRVANTRQRFTVTLTRSGTPLPALSLGILAGSDLKVTSGAVFGAPIHTNANLEATNALVSSAASASGTTSGNTFRTTARAAQPALTLPDSSLFNDYTPLATSIPFGSIPGGIIQRALIAPGINPFGSPNARGIYIIDCAGNNLTIRNSRILGTLIILNPGPASTLDNSIRWDPASDNFPILLVAGNFSFALSAAPLSEATLGTNFNPPAAPFNNASNTALTDSFSSELRGIIYTTGNIIVSNNLTLTGSLISPSTITITGSASISLNSNNTAQPPPGFQAMPVMRVSANSWRPITD
jgi:hypothetical protein